MKIKSKRSIAICCIIGLILCLSIGFIVNYIIVKRRTSWVVSCNNHERFLWFILKDYIENHKYLPSDTTKQGYIFIAELTSDRDLGTNCNHGAPHSSFGGWQMVNFPPETWEKIFIRWKPDSADPIPLIWCGKPTRTEVRVVTGIQFPPNSQTEGTSALIHYNMKEEELQERLKRLNDILIEIGEKSVELNIPDGIDWSKYKKSIENNAATPDPAPQGGPGR